MIASWGGKIVLLDATLVQSPLSSRLVPSLLLILSGLCLPVPFLMD